MSNFRAQDGFFSFGGKLVATVGPLLNGAKTVGQTSLNLDGTALTGVVLAGDQFTIAGESGSPVHTVTGGPYVAVANAITGLTFTPGIATGGVADNAVITFVNNSVAEIRSHTFQSSIDMMDDSVMGDNWKTFTPGLAEWGGTAEGWLDYGDAKQKALIDTLIAGTPSPSVGGVMFGFNTKKQAYGACVLSGFEVTSQLGALVGVKFTFKGNGPSFLDWN